MAVWNENPAKNMQKYIDNFLKYIQTNIDITYGSDNDNSEQPLNYNNVPIAFQGTCIKSVNSSQISGNSPNGFTGDMYFKYDLVVSQNGDNMVSNLELLGGSDFFIENVDNTYYQNLWIDFLNCNYTCTIKSELIDGYLYLPNDVNNNNDFSKQYHILKNEYDYTNITDTNFSGYSSSSGSQLYIEPWNVEYTIKSSNYNFLYGDVCVVNSHGRNVPNCNDTISKHMATTRAPSVLFTDNNTVINNYTTYGGNTYNDNDTYNNVINTYYGDNYLVLAPIGIGVNGELGFNFDDLVGALEIAVGDINTQLGYGLTVPTYDELKYDDQGSFYITPIKQIDKLPLAPDVADTVIDVSDYVDLLGGASTALFNALDSFGLSLIATFTFLSVLVIRHLKR